MQKPALPRRSLPWCGVEVGEESVGGEVKGGVRWGEGVWRRRGEAVMGVEKCVGEMCVGLVVEVVWVDGVCGCV